MADVRLAVVDSAPVIGKGCALLLHEGWSILTLADDRVLAGLLRLENVGIVDQWALDVPPNGVHHGYTAILSPKSIVGVKPCTEAEAKAFGSPAPPAMPQALAEDPDVAQASA